jgi:hypothetical protein
MDCIGPELGLNVEKASHLFSASIPFERMNLASRIDPLRDPSLIARAPCNCVNGRHPAIQFASFLQAVRLRMVFIVRCAHPQSMICFAQSCSILPALIREAIQTVVNAASPI